MNNLVIITAFLESVPNIKPLKNQHPFIICIDGGYDIALQHEFKTDLLMGDFDSIESKLPDNIPAEFFPPEKDYTDLELALKKAVDLGAQNVTVLGGIGGRLDHTIANMQLLSSYTGKFKSLVMLDGRNKCFVVNGSLDRQTVIPREDDSYLSIFSLTEKCIGVTMNGVKYQLENHTLTRDFPLGVSNEFKEKEAVLSIKDGALMVIISKK